MSDGVSEQKNALLRAADIIEQLDIPLEWGSTIGSGKPYRIAAFLVARFIRARASDLQESDSADD